VPSQAREGGFGGCIEGSRSAVYGRFRAKRRLSVYRQLSYIYSSIDDNKIFVYCRCRCRCMSLYDSVVYCRYRCR